jgi:hypothetical protein
VRERINFSSTDRCSTVTGSGGVGERIAHPTTNLTYLRDTPLASRPMRSRPIAVTAVIVAALAVALPILGSQHGAGSPARVPVTHAAIGFSDEDPGFFVNAYFRVLQRRLRISTARLIVAFNGATAASAAAWMNAAWRAGLSPYVTLGGDDSCNNPVGVHPATGNCPPPTDAVYTAGFVALVRSFPSVVDWGAWSEPSNYVYYPCATPRETAPPPANSCRSTRLDPTQAAAYWRDAEAVERQMSRKDTIVAGETGLDCTPPTLNLCTAGGGRTWTGFVPRYLTALGGARPAVWGAHSYHDLQRRPPLSATETNRFVKFLNVRAGAPRLWLTEEGTWLEGPNGALLNGNAAAQRAAAQEFLDLPLVPAASAGQVAREYYYFLKAKSDNRFDSALLDVSGTPRPAYCVLAGEPPADCRGSTTDARGFGALAPGRSSSG